MRRPVVSFLFVAATFVSRSEAQQPPPAQWWPKQTVDAQRADARTPWLLLLATPTLTTGRYRLAKGGTDGQTPHDLDEVYHVIAGAAKLQAGSETRAVAAGDTVFVPARLPHRFVDVVQDLDVLVFFSAARGTTGGMAAAPPPVEQTPFPETSRRGNTRIFYWFGPDSAGQVAIDFGRPRWQPAFAKWLDRPDGRRWRFGENFWTTLDTNIPLSIGGIEVAVGQYYCAMRNDEKAGLQLLLIDPAEVRAHRLDAYEANKTTGGLVIPLRRGKSDEPAGELDVELTVDPAAKDSGALTIRFGPHVLTADVRLRPHRG